MLGNFNQNFLAPGSVIVGNDGGFTNPARIWFLNIWNRTGQGTGIPLQVDTGLTATGTTPSTALQLNNDINEITGGGGFSGAILLALKQGQQQWVFNGSTSNKMIYPASGAQIDALGVNNPYTLAPGKTQLFTAYSTVQLRSLQLG